MNRIVKLHGGRFWIGYEMPAAFNEASWRLAYGPEWFTVFRDLVLGDGNPVDGLEEWANHEWAEPDVAACILDRMLQRYGYEFTPNNSRTWDGFQKEADDWEAEPSGLKRHAHLIPLWRAAVAAARSLAEVQTSEAVAIFCAAYDTAAPFLEEIPS